MLLNALFKSSSVCVEHRRGYEQLTPPKIKILNLAQGSAAVYSCFSDQIFKCDDQKQCSSLLASTERSEMPKESRKFSQHLNVLNVSS